MGRHLAELETRQVSAAVWWSGPSAKNRALPLQLHQERRGQGFFLRDITNMRCQTAFLFVLLTATCCLAADNLLRQQHEQELLRAKVCGLPMLVEGPGEAESGPWC